MRLQTSVERGDLWTRESPLQGIGIILVSERVQFFQIKNCKTLDYTLYDPVLFPLKQLAIQA